VEFYAAGKLDRIVWKRHFVQQLMHRYGDGTQTDVTVYATKSYAAEEEIIFLEIFSSSPVSFLGFGKEWNPKEFIYYLVVASFLEQRQFDSPLLLMMTPDVAVRAFASASL
jgi:hypothetical protein